MAELIGAFLSLAIVFGGLSMVMGRRGMTGKLTRVMGRFFIIFLIVAASLPALEKRLSAASSPLDLLIILLIAFSMLMLLIVAISPKFARNVLTQLFSSLLYDVLKGTVKLLFGGVVQIAKLLKK